jgi:hypothetical protein
MPGRHLLLLSVGGAVADLLSRRTNLRSAEGKPMPDSCLVVLCCEVLVRRGVALEIFTLLWMTVEAAVAVAAGSVALLAFGIDSVIEFVAALVVLQTFRAEQAGRPRRGGEERTLRVSA